MQRIINRLILIITVSFIGLFLYKAVVPAAHTAKVTTTTNKATAGIDKPSLQEEVEPIIREFLVNNPEVIIDAIEQLQKRKMQETESKVNTYIEEKKPEIESSEAAPFVGNEKGDIVIVSLYDYNCSYCKKSNVYTNQLLELDHNVKVIFRPFPILGETSTYAAKIALATYKVAPNKFKAIHEGLMNISPLSKEAIESLITTNDIDLSAINEEMTKLEIDNMLSKNFELAGKLRIRGAPAYIINGKLIPGLITLPEMQQIITDIRNK